jgi:hypothetical protein
MGKKVELGITVWPSADSGEVVAGRDRTECPAHNAFTHPAATDREHRDVSVLPIATQTHTDPHWHLDCGMLVSTLQFRSRNLLTRMDVNALERAVTNAMARCAFFGRNLHSRMPLDPTHVRLKRTCV